VCVCVCEYIYVYKTRLASNEIFSPSNKIHREVGRAKDLSAPQVIDGDAVDKYHKFRTLRKM